MIKAPPKSKSNKSQIRVEGHAASPGKTLQEEVVLLLVAESVSLLAKSNNATVEALAIVALREAMTLSVSWMASGGDNGAAAAVSVVATVVAAGAMEERVEV